jgi:hypothetical protein
MPPDNLAVALMTPPVIVAVMLAPTITIPAVAVVAPLSAATVIVPIAPPSAVMVAIPITPLVMVPVAPLGLGHRRNGQAADRHGRRSCDAEKSH